MFKYYLKLFNIILLIFTLNVNITASNLPDLLKVCHRNDSKFNDCVSNMMQSIKPYLKKGIPELDIPKCEPLFVPEIVLNQGSGSVNVHSVYNDINIWGSSNFTLRKLKIDLDKNVVKFKIYIPKLSINANYNMNGSILILPISGNGKCHGNYSNINVNVTMMLEKNIIDGEEYLYCNDLAVDFKIKDAKVQFDDLFQGNMIIGTAMNMFLNENKEIVIEELRPILEDVISDLFQTFANGIFGKIPLNKLFPD